MTRRGTGFRAMVVVVALLALAFYGAGGAIALDEAPGPATPVAEPPATEGGDAGTGGDVDLGAGGGGEAGAGEGDAGGGEGGGTAETESEPVDQGAGGEEPDGGEPTGEGEGVGSSTNESSGDTSGGDDSAGGSGEPADGGSSDQQSGGEETFAPAVTDDVEAADEETVEVIVQVYNCDDDPGIVEVGDPPAGCVAAPFITVVPDLDGTPLDPVVTDESGQAVIASPPGTALTVVEDPLSIPAGYEAREGDVGTTVSPIVDGAWAFLVNVLIPAEGEDDPEEELGRIQLVKGTCPTTGESRTELTVIGPNTLAAQAESVEGCHPAVGAEFLITGGDLPEEGLLVVTESNGSWRGELPPGPYTVTEVASGESVKIEVPDVSLVVVIAIEYIAPETGTLAVQRYACIDSELETETTTIETSLNPPAIPDPGPNCVAEDGQFQLDDGEPFDGGGDGAITFDVPVGAYEFADLTSGASAPVEIELDATTNVLVRRLVPGSELTVLYSFCEAEDAYLGSASDAAYWAATCPGTTAGIELRLLDAAGNDVGSAVTDESGMARWSNLMPGEYRVRGRGDRATCAVFVGDTPSLGGFAVSADTFYQGTVYGCFKPAPDDGTGGNGTGGNGTGNGTGGDGTGGENNGGTNNAGGNPPSPTGGGSAKSGDSGGSGGTTVTALPNTGTAGGPDRSSPIWPLLAALLVIGGLGAEALRRRRAA